MKDRTFMLVPHVMQISENMSNYSTIQKDMIDEFYTTVMRMVDDMEGESKPSLETAATHIKMETEDAIGRMTAHSIIYKLTGEIRLRIDEEAAKAAQANKLGAISSGKKGKKPVKA